MNDLRRDGDIVDIAFCSLREVYSWVCVCVCVLGIHCMDEACTVFRHIKLYYYYLL